MADVRLPPTLMPRAAWGKTRILLSAPPGLTTAENYVRECGPVVAGMIDAHRLRSRACVAWKRRGDYRLTLLRHGDRAPFIYFRLYPRDVLTAVAYRALMAVTLGKEWERRDAAKERRRAKRARRPALRLVATNG